jgi:hypothetical protein
VNGQGSPAAAISKPTARWRLPLTALAIEAVLLCVVSLNLGGIRQRLRLDFCACDSISCGVASRGLSTNPTLTISVSGGPTP